MTNKLAPIILFVYKRPEHTRKTVEALLKNDLADQSLLYVYCDGPKTLADTAATEDVRAYMRGIKGFTQITIIERPTNHGLSASIMQGVTEIINKHGKAIILEDDLVTSPFFLRHMNEALDLYAADERVASIHGYIYPLRKRVADTFFIRGADCWGWATWARAWKEFEPNGKKLAEQLKSRDLISSFDFDGSYPFSRMLERQIAGQTDSWAIRWYASAFLKDMLTLYPGKSLVENIGQDSSGTHGKNSLDYRITLTKYPIPLRRLPIREDIQARNVMISYFKYLKPNIFRRIIKRLL